MASTFFVNPRSNPELKSLYEISLFTQPDHLQDYFLGVMSILRNCFSIEYSTLFLYDSKNETLQLEAIYGLDRNLHPSSCSGREGTIGKTLESRQPMAISILYQEPLYAEFIKAQKCIEKIQPPLICFPLFVENEAIGVIVINSLYGPRDELTEDFQFFSILSAILSPVIKNYQIRKLEAFQKTNQMRANLYLLDEILEEKLAEVLNRIDPYVESKAKMAIFDDIISLVEKILIKSALKRVNYVQIAAAQLLGINRNTLRKKIKELKIKNS